MSAAMVSMLRVVVEAECRWLGATGMASMHTVTTRQVALAATCLSQADSRGATAEVVPSLRRVVSLLQRPAGT